MSKFSVTLDTSVLIDWYDGKEQSAPYVQQILEWAKQDFIDVAVSTRFSNVDTQQMNSEQYNAICSRLDDYGVETTASSLRFDVSTFDGPDVFDGPATRSRKELQRFEDVVGPEPTSLPPESVGKRLNNKVADYDALRDHYATNRDVFITADTRDYFCVESRATYRDKLGLVIQTPKEFVLEKATEFGITVPEIQS